MPPNVIAFVKSEVRLRKLYTGTRYMYLNVMLLMIQNVNCQCSGGGHLGIKLLNKKIMPEMSFSWSV